MKHDLVLTLDTGELARLDKLAARQGLTIEEVARGILKQAAYSVELTAADEEAIRRRALPRRRPYMIRLSTDEEYLLEKAAQGLRDSMESVARSYLLAYLHKTRLTPDDYEEIARREAQKERQLEEEAAREGLDKLDGEG